MNQFKIASERGIIITVVGALLMLTLPSVSAPTTNSLTINATTIQSQLSKVNLSIDQKVFGSQGKNSSNPNNNVARNWGFSSMVKAVTSTVSKAVAPIAKVVAAPVTKIVQAAIAIPAKVATVAVKAVAKVATVAVKAVATVVPAAAKALPAIEKVSTSITSTIAKTSTAMQANVAAASSTIQTIVNTAIVGVVVGLAVAAVTVAAIALAPASAAIAGATMAVVVMAAVTAGTVGAVACAVAGASPCSPKSAPIADTPMANNIDNTVPTAKATPSYAQLPKKDPQIVIDGPPKVEVSKPDPKPLEPTILKLDPAVNTDKPTAQDKVIIGAKVTEITTLVNDLTSQLNIVTDPVERQIIIDKITTLENAKESYKAILAKKVVRPS